MTSLVGAGTKNTMRTWAATDTKIIFFVIVVPFAATISVIVVPFVATHRDLRGVTLRDLRGPTTA